MIHDSPFPTHMLVYLVGISNKSRTNSRPSSRVPRPSPNTCTSSSAELINLRLLGNCLTMRILLIESWMAWMKTTNPLPILSKVVTLRFFLMNYTKKLINRELALKHSQFGHFSFPVTANIASESPTIETRPSHFRSTSGHLASGSSASP